MSVGAEVAERLSSGSINRMVFPFVLWDYAELLWFESVLVIYGSRPNNNGSKAARWECV